MARKTKPAPVPTPAEVQRKQRAPKRSPKELLCDWSAQISAQLDRLYRAMDVSHPLHDVIGTLVVHASNFKATVEQLPADLGIAPTGPVGQRFGIKPESLGRFRGLVEPLTVLEQYQDGRLHLVTVEDAKGARAVNCLLSQLKPWVAVQADEPADDVPAELAKLSPGGAP